MVNSVFWQSMLRSEQEDLLDGVSVCEEIAFLNSIERCSGE
jgi:hypothetical protein